METALPVAAVRAWRHVDAWSLEAPGDPGQVHLSQGIVRTVEAVCRCLPRQAGYQTIAQLNKGLFFY